MTCFKSIVTFLLISFSSVSTASDWIDLTYSFDESTIYWPSAEGFKIEKREEITKNDYYYAANIFIAPEHGGTHLDAPLHFAAGKKSVDEISVDQLKGTALLINLGSVIGDDADHLITETELKKWEQDNEPIKNGDIVIIQTGWGRFWKEKKKYMGTDIAGDVKNLHFPGLSEKAARYLITKKIKGLGVDTASLDLGQSRLFPVHRALLGQNIYGLENLANLDQIKKRRFFIIVAPMKITGGTGGPTRVYAVPNDELAP